MARAFERPLQGAREVVVAPALDDVPARDADAQAVAPSPTPSGPAGRGSRRPGSGRCARPARGTHRHGARSAADSGSASSFSTSRISDGASDQVGKVGPNSSWTPSAPLLTTTAPAARASKTRELTEPYSLVEDAASSIDDPRRGIGTRDVVVVEVAAVDRRKLRHRVPAAAVDVDGDAALGEGRQRLDDVPLLLPVAADEQDVTGQVLARLGVGEACRVGRDRQHGRDLGALGPDQASDGLARGEHEVVVVEPWAGDPPLRPVPDPRHRHQVPRQAPDVTGVEQHDDRLDRRVRCVPAILGPGQVRDAPAEALQRVAQLVTRVPVAESLVGIVAGDGDRDMERLAREPAGAGDPVEDRVTEDARPPAVDVDLAVAGHACLVGARVRGPRRRFVVPQGGTAVVDETAAGRPQLEAQVDVLEAVVVVRGEPVDLVEPVTADEQAGGGQGRTLGDLDGRRGQRILARSHHARDRDRLRPVERDAVMLQREVGEVGAGPPPAAMARIDQPRADRRSVPRRQRLDHVAEPVLGDRVDVVVQEADEGAGRHLDALVVGIGERAVLAVPEHPERERQVEALRHLGRAVGRAVVDHDDLDVAVRGPTDRAKAALEVLPPVAVEDDDRDQRAMVQRRRAETVAQRRDQGPLGPQRGTKAPLLPPPPDRAGDPARGMDEAARAHHDAAEHARDRQGDPDRAPVAQRVELATRACQLVPGLPPGVGRVADEGAASGQLALEDVDPVLQLGDPVGVARGLRQVRWLQGSPPVVRQRAPPRLRRPRPRALADDRPSLRCHRSAEPGSSPAVPPRERPMSGPTPAATIGVPWPTDRATT